MRNLLWAVVLLVLTVSPTWAQNWFDITSITPATTSCAISYTTGVPAKVKVRYGTNKNQYGSWTTVDNYGYQHAAILSGLRTNTTYHFQFQAADSSLVWISSPDYVCTTTSAPATISVSITPTSATVDSGSTQQFTATVAGTTNTGVAWTATAGTISAAGFFTAPTVTSDQSVTVKATSMADTSKSASALVTVKAPVTIAHTVDLNWNYSTSPNVINYKVFRGGTSGGPYTKVGETPSNTFTDLSVSAGRSYFYVATAVDNTGAESPYSNEAQANVPTP